MFESFRIVLSDGPGILPPNIVFGSTLISIQDVGASMIVHVLLVQLYSCSHTYVRT